MKKNLKKPLKGNPLRWLALLGFGAQLGLTIYLSIRLGQWIDHYYNTARILTLVSVLLGLLVSIVVLLRQLKKLNND